jgi:excisionase family DNA binding protein
MSRVRRSTHRALERRAGDAGALAQQQREDPLPILHSISTVARRLDVSEKSVRRYIERGRLPAYEIGGQIRIAERDVWTFLSSCRQRKEDV